MKRHLIGATLLSGVMILPSIGVAAHDGPHPELAAARTAQSDAPNGDIDANAAADLRTTLDLLLGEHLILAAKATGSALAGDSAAFEAYGGLLNTNGTDIGAMIGAVYGQEAQDAFNTSWSAHNGFFVDYTTGVAQENRRMQRRAVRDLADVLDESDGGLTCGIHQARMQDVIAQRSGHSRGQTELCQQL